jgi:hypothetical protein
MEKENIINRERVLYVHQRILSAVKGVEFVSDRVPYIVVIGRCCDDVSNVHSPSEEKSDDSKDRFYEELEQVSNNFPKYRIEPLLGDFNAKEGE